MSADTYGTVWRRVRLYCPLAPPFLVQDWVRNATRQFSDDKNWSFMVSEGEFHVGISRSGAVVFTEGSATVASAGGADGIVFVASDVGRQLRIAAMGPPITIVAVDTSGDTSCTLERAWQGASIASQTVMLSDIYATCPEDFGHFIAVIDPLQQRRVRLYMTMRELHAADPGRANVGTPWALVNYRLSQVASTLGRVQYEWWPYWEGTVPLRFPFYYFRRPRDLADDDYFEGPLRDRSDVVLYGALASAAEWPGTTLQRSPYFNLGLAARHRTRYEYEMGILEAKDEETYLTWLQDQWWSGEDAAGFGRGPVDAAYMQSHE
jgi:hypothetical protein